MTVPQADRRQRADPWPLLLAEKVLEFLAGGMERHDQQDLLVHLHQMSYM